MKIRGIFKIPKGTLFALFLILALSVVFFRPVAAQTTQTTVDVAAGTKVYQNPDLSSATLTISVQVTYIAQKTDNGQWWMLLASDGSVAYVPVGDPGIVVHEPPGGSTGTPNNCDNILCNWQVMAATSTQWTLALHALYYLIAMLAVFFPMVETVLQQRGNLNRTYLIIIAGAILLPLVQRGAALGTVIPNCYSVINSSNAQFTQFHLNPGLCASIPTWAGTILTIGTIAGIYVLWRMSGTSTVDVSGAPEQQMILSAVPPDFQAFKTQMLAQAKKVLSTSVLTDQAGRPFVMVKTVVVNKRNRSFVTGLLDVAWIMSQFTGYYGIHALAKPWGIDIFDGIFLLPATILAFSEVVHQLGGWDVPMAGRHMHNKRIVRMVLVGIGWFALMLTLNYLAVKYIKANPNIDLQNINFWWVISMFVMIFLPRMSFFYGVPLFHGMLAATSDVQEELMDILGFCTYLMLLAGQILVPIWLLTQIAIK
jgi:hypothetical protein